jgi:hypothetical protein
MTLIIQKPTTSKLILAKDYVGIDDPDAAVYIAAVEAADGEALETATKVAIHSFVKGCKADGIWTAIKTSCILAGARTLNGALVPLVGTAPTNAGGLFVSGDYNRKTGLVGNGSTKYLATSRTPTRNNQHISVFASTLLTPGAGAANFSCLIGARDVATADGSIQLVHEGPTNPNANQILFVPNSTSVRRSASTGFIGLARATSTESTDRVGGVTSTNVANTDGTTASIGFDVFRRSNGAFTQSRLAFYSIGEALNLSLLGPRVSDLINAIGAAIP